MSMPDANISKYTVARGDAHSDKSQISPKLSREIRIGSIHDSDDSGSPLSDTPDTIDLDEDVSFMLDSQIKSISEDEMQEALLKGDIMKTALEVPPKKRHQHMSDCFDRSGRLYKMFQCYNDDIRKEREARKEASRQQQPLKEATVVETPRPDGANEHSEQGDQRRQITSQVALSNGDSQNCVQKRQGIMEAQGPNSKRKPFKDTGGISCQPCREKEQPCESFVDSLVGMSCISCFHAKETCPLSTGRKLRDPKPDTPSEPTVHSESQPPRMRQSHTKDQSNSRAESQISSDKQPCASVVPETASRRASKTRPASQTRRAPQTSRLTASSRTTVATKAALHSSEAQRERRVAAQTVHETLQRQLTHARTHCDTCLHSPCSCHSSPISREDILCNGERCSKRWFSNDYLEKYLGITLNDARDFRRKYGFWCCPECSYKKDIQDSRGPNLLDSTCTLPKYGSEFLEAEDVSRSLKEFWGLTSQYIRMANKNAAPPSIRMQSLLQIPCIRDEASDERHSALVSVLRQILRVDPGILVKDKVLNSQLQDLEPAAWMRAVLVYLFFQFVFRTPFPFDDAAIWRKGLLHSFKSDNVVDMWVQDNRIRNMLENSGSYQARCKDENDKHIRLLNAAMMPLIGGVGSNEGLNRIHKVIAEIAGDLNAKFSAYTGEFEAIMPGFGDRFEAEIHTSQDPMDEDRDLSNRYVMLTTMVGVRFRIPGQLQTWSKAKVRLWPKSDEPSGTSYTPLPCASESSDGRARSKKRPYHDLVSPESDWNIR